MSQVSGWVRRVEGQVGRGEGTSERKVAKWGGGVVELSSSWWDLMEVFHSV